MNRFESDKETSGPVKNSALQVASDDPPKTELGDVFEIQVKLSDG